MRNSINLLLVFLIFGSCTQKNERECIKDFTVKDTLYAKTIQISQSILMPTKIFAINDKLIIYDQTKDNIFKVFKLPEMKHLYNYGKIGKGPGEFIYIDGNSIKKMNDHLVLLDNHSIKTIEIGNEKMEILSSRQIRIEGAPLNRLQMINDSIYIADDYFGGKSQYEHQMVNIFNKTIIKQFGYYPDEGLKFKDEIEKYQTFIKAPVSHPVNGKFAAFYLYFDLLKIYDSNGKLSHFISIDHKFPKVSPKSIRESIIFRSEPVSTFKHIYVLCIEKSKEEVQNNISSFRPKIEIWNWDGELLAKFQLNKPIVSFAISEDCTKLYGVSFINMNEIYEFDLSKLSELGDEKRGKLKLIENDYYRINVPVNSYYATGTPEQKRNDLVRINGLLCNSNIFIIKPSEEYSGLSMWITVFSNKNNMTIKDFTKKRDERILSACKYEDLKISSKIINGKNAMITNFTLYSLSSKGEQIKTNHYYMTWIEGEFIVQIKFGSDGRDKQKYLNNIDDLVSSFSLKKNIDF